MGTFKSRMERVALVRSLVKKAGEKGLLKKRIIAILMINGCMLRTANELLDMCVNLGEATIEEKGGEDYVYG